MAALSILPKKKHLDNSMYWKLSQHSFFGRIEDTIIWFRDCLTFIGNPPDGKLVNPTSMQWWEWNLFEVWITDSKRTEVGNKKKSEFVLQCLQFKSFHVSTPTILIKSLGNSVSICLHFPYLLKETPNYIRLQCARIKFWFEKVC